MSEQVTLFAGDTAPSRLTYKDGGTPVDVTDYAFELRLGTSPVKAVACIVANGPAGIIEIPWSAGDLVVGSWPMQMVVTDAGGKVRTLQLKALKVVGRLA